MESFADPRGRPPVVAPMFDLREKKVWSHRRSLCTSNPYMTCAAVEHCFERCEKRRSGEPRPGKVAWEHRPKWNGSIINLTPVVDGPGRARCAVPVAFAAVITN